MRQRYCYWSVCDGPYAALMRQCVQSARRAGVFKEFHVLTDRPVEDCECYDAMEIEKTDQLFKLIYLKAGIAKLLFDYFVWIDADSWFVRNPTIVPDCPGKSPIHVPLTTNLSGLREEKPLPGSRGGRRPFPSRSAVAATSASPTVGPDAGRSGGGAPALIPGAAGNDPVPTTRQYADLMIKAGVFNPVYFSRSSFWIVHHDVFDRVCDLAQHFRAIAGKYGFTVDVSAGLGYAMQMLCANPEAHRLTQRPDVWASDDQDYFQGQFPGDTAWPWEDPLNGETQLVRPCIIHLPHQAARQLHSDVTRVRQLECAGLRGDVTTQTSARPAGGGREHDLVAAVSHVSEPVQRPPR